MKKLILCMFISLLFLLSCATTAPQISENDYKLQMIGGKEALLDAIIYPDFALRKGIEGQILLMAYVDTAGNVIDCEVLQGNDYLNDAAIAALKQQRFYPYYLNGVKSPVRVAIPISFTINKEIDIVKIEDRRLMSKAESYLEEDVIVLEEFISDRSPGKVNDYYSEGQSWWPVPGKPNDPYRISENKKNPQAFLDHKNILIKTGDIISSLTSLYLITDNKLYANKAVDHIKAWFIDKETRMSPHMRHAQTIPNRNTGRFTGIYEAAPLIEIVRSAKVLSKFFNNAEKEELTYWLKEYSKFLIYDKFGVSMRAKKNIYGMAWLAQMVIISDYLDDDLLLKSCWDYYEQITIPYILSANAAFYKTPANMMLVNDILIHADYLSVIATVLNEKDYDAWNITDKYGRRPGDLVNYIYSALLNNRIDRGEHYKGRFTFLYLTGKAYDNFRYLDLWRGLQEHNLEVVFPVKEVLLW